MTLALALFGASCGDDSPKQGNNTNNPTNNNNNPTNNNNNPTNNNNNPTNNNNNPTNNNNNPTNNNNTPFTCDKTGFTGTASIEGDQEVQIISMVSSQATPYDLLSIEFFPEVGGPAPSPLTGPGTYPIGATPADQNYQTCQTCVLIREQCGDASCDKTYFATSGSLVVTQYDLASGIFVGTLNDVQFREVTIDPNADFRSTVVPNGSTWCIEQTSYNIAPECIEDADCTDASKPFCTSQQVCVQCKNTFDCDASVPYCVQGACNAAETCTGDVDEPNNHPTQAIAIAPGVAAMGGICEGANLGDIDWYTFALTETRTLTASLDWTGDADLDFYLVDANGATITGSENDNPPAGESFVALLNAGTYYFVVTAFDTSSVGGGTEAVMYGLTFDTQAPCTNDAECTGTAGTCEVSTGLCIECGSDLDCSATNPVCLGTGLDAVCGVIDLCADDDAREHGDDGPNGANPINVGESIDGKICGEAFTPSSREADWFTFTLDADATITITVSWTAPDTDLDFALFDDPSMPSIEEGLGTDNPEVVSDIALTAGQYWIRLNSFEAGGLTVDYNLVVTAQ